MRIHLIRHGEVENPEHVVYADLPGYGLSPAGRKQAALAARYLQQWPIDRIVSSPLERAVETSRLLGDGNSIEIEDRLTEWRLTSRWAGVVWEELSERFPGELEAYLDHPQRLPFSEESLAELATRVGTAVAEWADSSNRDVVFVSHQDPIHAARLLLTGGPFGDFHNGKPEHCSVSTLEPANGGWTTAAYWAPLQ